MTHRTQWQDLRGQEMSVEPLVAPAGSGMPGHEHDQVFEVPALLFGDPFLEGRSRASRLRPPGLGNADADKGIRREDQAAPALHGFDSVQPQDD